MSHFGRAGTAYSRSKQAGRQSGRLILSSPIRVAARAIPPCSPLSRVRFYGQSVVMRSPFWTLTYGRLSSSAI